MAATPQLVARHEDGVELSTLVWRLAAPMRCVSTAAIGGGFVDCDWVVNAQVPKGYHRDDLEAHGAAISAAARPVTAAYIWTYSASLGMLSEARFSPPIPRQSDGGMCQLMHR